MCNYTLNAIFFFFLKEVCVAAQTLNLPENGYIAQSSPFSDNTEENGAIRWTNGLY